MRYLHHRPFAFWLSAVTAIGITLVVSALVGAGASPVTTENPSGSHTAAASQMMAAYGELIAAADTETARGAAGELGEVAERCAGWDQPGCADVSEELESYLDALADVEADAVARIAENSPEDAETPEPGDAVTWNPAEHTQLIAARRAVGTAVNEVVTSTR